MDKEEKMTTNSHSTYNRVLHGCNQVSLVKSVLYFNHTRWLLAYVHAFVRNSILFNVIDEIASSMCVIKYTNNNVLHAPVDLDREKGWPGKLLLIDDNGNTFHHQSSKNSLGTQ